MDLAASPCEGSRTLVGTTEFRRGVRFPCPVCGREIAVNGAGEFYRHVRSLTQRSRLYAEAQRMRQVRACTWRHYPSVDVVLRLWFRDYGGAAAFERLRLYGSPMTPLPMPKPRSKTYSGDVVKLYMPSWSSQLPATVVEAVCVATYPGSPASTSDDKIVCEVDGSHFADHMPRQYAVYQGNDAGRNPPETEGTFYRRGDPWWGGPVMAGHAVTP